MSHDGRNYVVDAAKCHFCSECISPLCDLRKRDKVDVVGPYGTTFLMPNHPGASLPMVCTGTGLRRCER